MKKHQKARKASRQIGLETAVPPETSSAEKPKSRILKEITDKREKNVKHFLKDDLTFEAAVYNEPVHYFRTKSQEPCLSGLIQKAAAQG